MSHPSNTHQKERNWAIWRERHVNGTTFKDIGAMYGITGSRANGLYHTYQRRVGGVRFAQVRERIPADILDLLRSEGVTWPDAPPPPEPKVEAPVKKTYTIDTRIRDIDWRDLPTRTYNCLRSRGKCLYTIGDVCACEVTDLLDISGFGMRSLTDVIEFLARHGLPPIGTLRTTERMRALLAENEARIAELEHGRLSSQLRPTQMFAPFATVQQVAEIRGISIEEAQQYLRDVAERLMKGAN